MARPIRAVMIAVTTVSHLFTGLSCNSMTCVFISSTLSSVCLMDAASSFTLKANSLTVSVSVGRASDASAFAPAAAGIVSASASSSAASSFSFPGFLMMTTLFFITVLNLGAMLIRV